MTTLYEDAADRADEFLQVKYHVDKRGQYSTDLFLDKKTKASRSLLEKFFATWRLLTADLSRRVELRLVSNWAWDAADPVAGCIQGKDNALSAEFFTANARTDVGKVRERWRKHLGVEPDEFKAFAQTLRFRLGFDCFDELAERMAERMVFLKLKSDASALLVAVGIVRDLIKAGSGRLTRADLEALLKRHDLILPKNGEPATVLYLTTVKTQQFELPPDFHLDWCEYFDGDPAKKTTALSIRRHGMARCFLTFNASKRT